MLPWRLFGSSDVPAQAHALMQDPHHPDNFCIASIDDDVRTNHIGQVSSRQVAAAMTHLRIPGYRLQRFVDLVTVGQELGLAPFFTGVTQYVDEVLPRFR